MSAVELGGAVHSPAGVRQRPPCVCICTHDSDRQWSRPLLDVRQPGSRGPAVSTAPPPTLTVGLSLVTVGPVLFCKLAQVVWVPCAGLMGCGACGVGVGPVAGTRLPSCLFCGAIPHVCSSSVPACPAWAWWWHLHAPRLWLCGCPRQSGPSGASLRALGSCPRAPPEDHSPSPPCWHHPGLRPPQPFCSRPSLGTLDIPQGCSPAQGQLCYTPDSRLGAPKVWLLLARGGGHA